MTVLNYFKKLFLILFVLISANVNSGVFDFVDDMSNGVKNILSDKGIKPYVIPLEQGRLIDDNDFSRLAPGLSKQQVEYLIGLPPVSSPFKNNQWEYMYFNNDNQKQPKNITIIFKNEKVFEILVNKKTYKKIGNQEIDYDIAENAPIRKQSVSQVESKEKESIVIALADFKTLDNRVDICKINKFEIFNDIKTLANADESTLEIRADNQNQTDDLFTATGNAEAERANDLLKAETITYNTQSKNITATNEVKYYNEELTVYSKKADYQNDIDEVNFSKAKYYFAKKDGSGNSEEIFVKKNKDVVLIDGTYTACSLDDPDWELTSTKTILYNESDRGHAYNMFLKYKNVPIFYTPFISFPLSDKRQSGILTPSFGTSDDSGSTYSVPYYFNLAENYDATVHITSFSKRGVLFDNEFRYLGESSSSLYNFSLLESDDKFGKDRYLYSFKDRRNLINDFSLLESDSSGLSMNSEISYGRVSDLKYFDDFGNSLSTASQSSVKRELRLYGEKISENGITDFELSSLSYQPAQSGVVNQYQTVPSFKLNYVSFPSSNSYQYNFKASIDEFKHKDNSKTEGTRYVLYPSIEMPIQTESWEIIPKLGIRHIDYSLSNNSLDEKSKTTPIMSLRGKIFLEKVVGNKIYTLEPEAYFLYVPVGNQDNNPIFDSGLKEFKYSLFTENRFYGEDRLSDSKQMTLALTHRIIDDQTGDELLSGTLGQIIYFDDRDVHITAGTKHHSDASNIIGLLNSKVSDNGLLSIGSVFNPHEGHGMRNTIRYRYDASTESRNQLFNFDYRFHRGNEEEIDLSGVYSFNNSFSVVGKHNYSFSNDRSGIENVPDTMFGMEFNSCCYAFKIVARKYWTGTENDNIIYFEFLPKGLTTSNNEVSTVLRNGVPGYIDRVDYD
tara:strand:+ start:8911 stop:11610 length:2700 start_codon:yes stop_codon:yes gene_type:complete